MGGCGVANPEDPPTKARETLPFPWLSVREKLNITVQDGSYTIH